MHGNGSVLEAWVPARGTGEDDKVQSGRGGGLILYRFSGVDGDDNGGICDDVDEGGTD